MSRDEVRPSNFIAGNDLVRMIICRTGRRFQLAAGTFSNNMMFPGLIIAAWLHSSLPF